MPRRTVFALLAAALTAPACAQETAPDSLTSPILASGGTEVGQLTLQATAGGVIVRIEAEGLPESERNAWHGAHLHVRADCSAADFTSAGGHINPDGRAHGLSNPDGPDNADMPNVWVDGTGAIRAEIFTPRVRLFENVWDGPALLDEDGSALVIHVNPDDHASQPIGGAGARLLCAEIGG